MQFAHAAQGPAAPSSVYASPYDDRSLAGRPRGGAVRQTLSAAFTLLVMAVLCIGMIWLMGAYAGK